MIQKNFLNYNKLLGSSLLTNMVKIERWLTGLYVFLLFGCAIQDFPKVGEHLGSELSGRVQIVMGQQKVVLNFKALVKKDIANLEVWGAMGMNRQSFLLASEPLIFKQKIGNNWIDLSEEDLAKMPISALPVRAFPYWIKGVPRASSPHTVLREGGDSNSFIQDNWEIEVIRSPRVEDERQATSKLHPREITMTSGGIMVRWLIKIFENDSSRFDTGLLHQENSERS